MDVLKTVVLMGSPKWCEMDREIETKDMFFIFQKQQVWNRSPVELRKM